MKEKLSVKKVYRNAFRYVRSHLFAFLFLTIFYFLGSLLPLFIDATAFKIISLIYTYLFFYFAAGCYYKQQILWDRHIFMTAGVRFLGAVTLFLGAIIISSVVINFGIQFLRITIFNNNDFLDNILNSSYWLIGKYSFIFMLFVVFFIVPSFAFVSEITGKNRSLLTTYAKTKGNLFAIGLIAVISFILLMLCMLLFSHAHFIIVGFLRAGLLVFVSILYFKMYDFFYSLPQNLNNKKSAKETKKVNSSKQKIIIDDNEGEKDADKR